MGQSWPIISLAGVGHGPSIPLSLGWFLEAIGEVSYLDPFLPPNCASRHTREGHAVNWTPMRGWDTYESMFPDWLTFRSFQAGDWKLLFSRPGLHIYLMGLWRSLCTGRSRAIVNLDQGWQGRNPAVGSSRSARGLESSQCGERLKRKRTEGVMVCLIRPAGTALSNLLHMLVLSLQHSTFGIKHCTS